MTGTRTKRDATRISVAGHRAAYIRMVEIAVSIPAPSRTVIGCVRALNAERERNGLEAIAEGTVRHWADFGVVIAGYPVLERPLLDVVQDIESRRLSLEDIGIYPEVGSDQSGALLLRALSKTSMLLDSDEYMAAIKKDPGKHKSMLSTINDVDKRLRADTVDVDAVLENMDDEGAIKLMFKIRDKRPEAFETVLKAVLEVKTGGPAGQ